MTVLAFDCWLALHGLRTLYLRITRQQEYAAAMLEFLDCHPVVRQVHYPGLVRHPGYNVAASRQRGHGAIVSFELDGGRAAVERFVTSL